MKHETIEDLTSRAEVTAVPTPVRRSKRQRLERLASLLDKHQGPIGLFSGIEYLSEDEVDLRCDHSPLSVAFADRIFRDQGLAGDRLADAMTFFELSRGEVHFLLCDCHQHTPVSSAAIARRARSLARWQAILEPWAALRTTLKAWLKAA